MSVSSQISLPFPPSFSETTFTPRDWLHEGLGGSMLTGNVGHWDSGRFDEDPMEKIDNIERDQPILGSPPLVLVAGGSSDGTSKSS